MGISNIAPLNNSLGCFTEIWEHVLFWAFLLSFLTYLVVGIYLGIVMPVFKKRLRLLIPILYVIYSLIRLLFVEVIASGFLAGIYVTSGWAMTTGVALGWGLGLSVGTNSLSVLISLVPLYGFL